MRPDLRVAALLACLSMALAIGGCSSNHDASPTDAAAPPVDGLAADDARDDAPAVPSSDAELPPAGDAGSDAPTGDGGRDYGTDRTEFFGDSRCADSGLQLCEDFESGMINPSIWTVSGTKPVVDTMQHARGTHALHITQDGNGLSYIKETKTFPEPDNTYFGRVFVYFKSLPAPMPAPDGGAGFTYAHWTMLAASGTGVAGEIRVSGQLEKAGNIFGVGTDNETDSGTGDWTNSDKDPGGTPSPVPLDKWLCIEWMHKGDTSETQFWWDGVLHPSLSTSPTVHGGNKNPYLLPDFNQVWVGWQEYQPTSEVFELWIDEVAIDTSRIGCVL